MSKSKGSIGVVGAGSWGTTLANLLARKGFKVDLWAFEKELCDLIRTTGENKWYLPGSPLHENLTAHNDLESVVVGRQFLLMAVPSQVYRPVAARMVPLLAQNARIVTATKGIENDTLLTMSGVWQELLPQRPDVKLFCLSGPSFAHEVALDMPTAVTIAGDEIESTKAVQEVFSTPVFRVYTSLDRIGLELAGASKNVIAVAAGICDGLSLGYNTRAALITRGLAEISRLGCRMGAHPLTFSGLAGIGDLLLTCTGDLSRNRTVGIELAHGKKLDEILGSMRMVAEGVATARSIHFLAKRMGVEMPICEQVYRVLYENKDPLSVTRELMQRDLKHELEFDTGICDLGTRPEETALLRG
jgi:glycerol-3-phosphate dehydrogenase (NAD(P)+)